MKIFIGGDHLGSCLVDELVNYLSAKEIDVVKVNLDNNPLDNYPDFAYLVGKSVMSNKDSLGIVICGNGIGIGIAANKVKGIRCARVLSCDDAFKCRNHNGCNVIALSSDEDINNKEIVDTFINTEYVSNPKYLNRVDIVNQIEDGIYEL